MRQGFGRPLGAWIIAVLLVCLVGWSVWESGRAVGEATEDRALLIPPPPDVRAGAAALFDLETGRLLYAKNAFSRQSPNGLAAILASVTALARSAPDDEVRISTRAAQFGGTMYDLFEGERLTLEDLVRIMLFRPGDEATVAVAEHVAGSLEAFARQMNAEARRIGATATHFEDPSGAGAGESYTTPFDLGLIGREAMGSPTIVRIVGAPQARVMRRGQSRAIFNVNSFLRRRSDATGVRTSYSPESGYSMVGTVARGTAHLLVVVMGSPSANERYKDAVGMLEYGLRYLESLRLDPQVAREQYSVREGDTLSELAKRFDVPVAAIRQFNVIDNPDALRSGESLWIPR